MVNTNRYKAYITELCVTGHWTAEKIHKALKKRYPLALLGIGTVYRNLGELVEENVLMKHEMLGDKMIYEARKPPHGHIFCETTSTLYDIDISKLSLDTIQLPPDFVVENVQLTFRGHFVGGDSACHLTSKISKPKTSKSKISKISKSKIFRSS